MDRNAFQRLTFYSLGVLVTALVYDCGFPPLLTSIIAYAIVRFAFSLVLAVYDRREN